MLVFSFVPSVSSGRTNGSVSPVVVLATPPPTAGMLDVTASPVTSFSTEEPTPTFSLLSGPDAVVAIVGAAAVDVEFRFFRLLFDFALLDP